MLDVDKEIAIPKNFFYDLTNYARKLHDSSQSDWNYLMTRLMSAAINGDDHVVYCSEGNFFNVSCVDIVKKYQDDLRNNGLDVDIRETNIYTTYNKKYYATFVTVSWAKEEQNESL